MSIPTSKKLIILIVFRYRRLLVNLSGRPKTDLNFPMLNLAEFTFIRRGANAWMSCTSNPYHIRREELERCAFEVNISTIYNR